MSLSFCTLASGSKGNCIYVAAGEQAVLIDCGLSARETIRRIEARGLSPHAVKAILITHEHTDHTRGVRVLAKRLRIPALATEATWAAAKDTDAVRYQPMCAGRGLEMAGIQVHPFSVPHDAADPVGLVLTAGGVSLGVATDLGAPTGLVRRRLAGCAGLVLEHNHDARLLAEGSYPPWLKQRVRSAQGHLSNDQGAELLAELIHPGLKQVVLAHLSEQNNRPELARRAAQDCLDGRGSRAGLWVAAQERYSEVFEV
ncbi:MBL fold metallo-hydrolase [Desulfoferula mesophila]|uniref:MBL fold metallo-hydrolase n=1 Tax=Desulfoferula mesophila TaxID=3058419 RepID=A0AAU9EFI8_9BACT|nr:MBL fold metallo-hydrolase [Desulfoferula mesophilus]